MPKTTTAPTEEPAPVREFTPKRPAAETEEWYDVPWREYDLQLLRYAEGRASEKEIAAVLTMNLSRSDLDRQLSRVKELKRLLPMVGSRSELAKLEQREAAELSRIRDERAKANERFRIAQEEHESTLQALKEQEADAIGAARQMRSTQEQVNRMIPASVRQARFAGARAVRHSETKDQLDNARGRKQFLEQASIADFGSGKFIIPGFLFDPESPAYIGPKPEVSPKIGQTETQALGAAIKEAWDAKREELRAQIPIEEREIARLEQLHKAAVAEADQKLKAAASYVPE